MPWKSPPASNAMRVVATPRSSSAPSGVKAMSQNLRKSGMQTVMTDGLEVSSAVRKNAQWWMAWCP
ncbi:MAG TPA: hypothetical protein DCM87_10035 [Planctomycetes bacterium]|nr:hypothetical protein [Planctomycetota bacterium]